MEKIRFRLVYNRKNKLNNQGTALIQVEALLNHRKVYFSTNIYVRPEHWDKSVSQIIGHPMAFELNTMIYDFLIYLQRIEFEQWKRGVHSSLVLLKESVRNKRPVRVTFIEFAEYHIRESDRKKSTKENMMTTITSLKEFRKVIEFKDITYAFLKDFECFLREKGNGINTVAKHLRQLRTLVNEAINQGYIHADEYPFRKMKIRQEKGKNQSLSPSELKRLEKLEVNSLRLRHVLDAFLFCCYSGLRFSDFKSVKNENIVCINSRKWLVMKSRKTSVNVQLPLYLLFGGKSLALLEKYSLNNFSDIGSNPEINKDLSRIADLANIGKHITFHTARHTFATLLIHQGVPITTVQKLLGHTSLKTTQIYSEILNSTVVRDLRAVKPKNRK